MSIETFRMRDLNAAKDEFSPRDELVNIISDADVNHATRLGDARTR